MNAGTRIEQTPTGIKMGSAYAPTAYEIRTTDEYRALRPVMTQDGARLQAALLARQGRATGREILDGIIGTACIAGLVSLIYFGHDLASWLGVL